MQPTELHSNNLKKHKFFEGIDWENLRKMKSPIIPEVSGPTDCRHFDEFPDDEPQPEEEVDPSAAGQSGAWDGFTYKRVPKPQAITVSMFAAPPSA